MADTIGVRELKAHLSRHLKRVQAGARLTVTDRGRSIATISPVEQPADLSRMLDLVEAGLATWSGGKPTGLTPPARLKGRRLVSDAVLEDRE